MTCAIGSIYIYYTSLVWGDPDEKATYLSCHMLEVTAGVCDPICMSVPIPLEFSLRVREGDANCCTNLH